MLNQHLPYFLGLPAWADPAWRGGLLPRSGSAISAYSKVFNTVEGNTTFYQIPNADTVAAWRDAVQGTPFRFSFKLPRGVTHEAYPRWEELRRFLNVVEPLFENLGPFLIQLSEKIGPAQQAWMNNLLRQLPHNFQHVLEVRHPHFFEHPESLEPILDQYGLGRVVMDTRSLFSGDRNHPEAQDALKKKPNLPILKNVYHDLFYLRLILHPERSNHQAIMQEWAEHVVECLLEGKACFLMIHCANNAYAPDLAQTFHRLVREQLGSEQLPKLPEWGGPSGGQAMLFWGFDLRFVADGLVRSECKESEVDA